MKQMSPNVATLNNINVGRGKNCGSYRSPIVEPLASSVFDVTGRKNVALLPDLHLNSGRCKFTTFRMHTDMAKGTLLAERQRPERPWSLSTDVVSRQTGLSADARDR